MNPVVTILSYLIGIAIPLFAIYIMYSFDLFGTGKSSTMLTCVVWGAISVLLALQVNNGAVALLSNMALPNASPSFGPTEITIRFIAPIVEEVLKSAMLFFFITRPRFRYIVDGAMYGFASGIGFAVAENVLYISRTPGAPLSLAVARALSTSLMHATTSALIGIALGHLRRSTSSQKVVWALGGLVPAMAIHITYNNIVNALDGPALLLVAIGIGVLGFGLISYQIRRGVAEEKKRFADTLGLGVGVTDAERKAVQGLGDNTIENVLNELGAYFGTDKAESIRRLLVLQANVGILQNNLSSSQVSERLKKAWEAEIAEKREEMDKIRNGLGVYIMSFVRNVFPPEGDPVTEKLNKEYTKFDPTQVHSFDLFINAGRQSGTLDLDKLVATADLLSQVEIFKDVPVAELENLSRAIVSRVYTHSQTLFEQGMEGDTMYIVEDGMIEIFVKEEGREKPINSLQSGDLVGELALLDGAPRSAAARAKGELKVLMLRRDHFLMFVSSRPHVILALLEYMAKRARRLSDMVEHSVEWASRITQGDYDGAMAVAHKLQPAGFSVGAPRASLKSIRVQLPAVPQETARADNTEPEHAMGGLFARMSSTLEQRDTRIKTVKSVHMNLNRDGADNDDAPPESKERPSLRMGGSLFAKLKPETPEPKPETDAKKDAET
jgi:RsiW-degrading membrane proteinase PrsW (M82 family)/CRP-like cAMP-binding protein